ncbi:MAG: hypothetical protein IJP68_12370 [Selenomonadaceae bacterium]|nr:hypothetical protein [Selenomonadaceae bacterium]
MKFDCLKTRRLVKIVEKVNRDNWMQPSGSRLRRCLPCHCSGEEFMNHFGARLSSGSVIVLE